MHTNYPQKEKDMHTKVLNHQVIRLKMLLRETTKIFTAQVKCLLALFSKQAKLNELDFRCPDNRVFPLQNNNIKTPIIIYILLKSINFAQKKHDEFGCCMFKKKYKSNTDIYIYIQ